MEPGISAWEDRESWKQRKWMEILSCARTVHSTANHYHEPNKQARPAVKDECDHSWLQRPEIVDHRILASRSLRAVVWTKEVYLRGA